MTFDEALTCLKELRALERVRLAIAQQGATSAYRFEWTCTAVAIRDRLQLLTVCLSQQDQALLDAVQVRYDAEIPDSGRHLEFEAATGPVYATSTSNRIH